MDEYSGYLVSGIDGERRRYFEQLASDQSRRKLVTELTVPAQRGRAFVVGKDQILRITCTEGPQVADFNAFNRHEPRQMFWSGRTRILQRTHLTVGDQLWSTPPKMEPMFTIIADSVEHKSIKFGARSHDLLYSRCNARLYEVVMGQKGLPNCQDNLANAIAEFGMTPDYVHDAFNIFMTTGRNDQDRLFYLEPDAVTGDYLELYAEMDCIVALSACPSGSSAQPIGSPTTGNFPLGVKIFEPIPKAQSADLQGHRKEEGAHG
jgi:uncharacterized protein YcgI (DUF1989 family)